MRRCWVYRLAHQIPAHLGVPSGRPAKTLAPLAREDFISKKLAPKLAQQLKVLLTRSLSMPAVSTRCHQVIVAAWQLWRLPREEVF